MCFVEDVSELWVYFDFVEKGFVLEASGSQNHSGNLELAALNNAKLFFFTFFSFSFFFLNRALRNDNYKYT